ncbi:MAG: hypothetical protein LW697_07940 [Blastopirellula sp.]|nr:hypothetical protein [Blastopirellula sp.]
MKLRSDKLGRMVRVLALFAALIAIAGEAAAQRRYDPNHPDVETVVNRGIAFVEANAPRGIDEQLLAALAIIETKKRYENEIPRDHPIVQAAVAGILDAVNGDQSGGATTLLRNTGAYIPCLGVIVLCEVNDQLYANQINYLLDLFSSVKTPMAALVIQATPR